jgi:hypothetical protein
MYEKVVEVEVFSVSFKAVCCTRFMPVKSHMQRYEKEIAVALQNLN